jgi:hypothetical protein
MINRTKLSLLGGVLVAGGVFGQNGIITTIAGSDSFFPPGTQALNAPFGALAGIALDSDGSIVTSDYDNDIVVRVLPDGPLKVIGGNGIFGLSGNGGLATAASFSHPEDQLIVRRSLPVLC